VEIKTFLRHPLVELAMGCFCFGKGVDGLGWNSLKIVMEILQVFEIGRPVFRCFSKSE